MSELIATRKPSEDWGKGTNIEQLEKVLLSGSKVLNKDQLSALFDGENKKQEDSHR